MKKKSIGLLLASAYLFHARSRQKSLKACLFEDSLRLSQIARLERNPKVTKAFYHWQRSLNEQVTLPKHLRHLFPLQEMTQFPTMYRMSNSVIAPTKKAVLYLHGGGFTLNLAYSQLDFSYKLIEDLPFATDYFIPVYPLAPNKSFADIYNHCYAAYQEILQHYDPEDVILLGDSAGGTLVLNVLQNLAIDFPERLPKAAVLISPWLDGHLDIPVAKSYQKKDKMIGMNYLQLIAQEIDDTTNHATLSLNCLSFDYQKFPPLFFVGGTHEVFCPSYHQFLKQLGPRPQDTCRLVPGMQHVFAMKQYLPEGRQARKQIAQFIQEQW
ncbi:alpha/beta hydrolase [Enterococcus faecalis]|uniref:alpha/beta hydrolase n=1 Tax=Enterococcus faecalis TaxID=1351 RepID=UPI000A3485C4|nr:alpha/beta hydrolase [Enterococcus faecalis]EGO5241611.1 alpha/beta hydrolase [Enterococcus faecalis]EGO6137864.1 alpha/beta hydrolase [Enterococcus faecalis]EGO7885765.1 alpha/beta hydrolase [Enterococcus faecalis]EGO8636832.1 alpha/beta hydrolase [Enterococcus faecalis]EGO9216223.1 alpha/beta hydrolase [Enterococcus faecalis]